MELMIDPSDALEAVRAQRNTVIGQLVSAMDELAVTEAKNAALMCQLARA